jgi:hypothetical protein
MNPQFLLLLAVAVFMGWYALGTIYNVRRGQTLLQWMQTGLPRLGEKTTLRWLGSSVVEMVIGQAKGPARRAEVLVVLKPRDVPFTWLYATARGRSDFIIVRMDLVRAPRLALELADPDTWTGRMSIADARSEGWESREYGERTLLAPAGLLKLAAELVEPQCAGRPLSGDFHRFSLRKDPARLEIHLPFPNPRQTDAEEFFAAIQDLAKAI